MMYPVSTPTGEDHTNAENYRPEIDGLRAIAVLAVVFYHFDIPGFTGGYVGVDVFFVISGFLITRIIANKLVEGDFSLQEFYFRRIMRIFPAFFAMISTTTLAAFIFLTPSDLIAYSNSLVASSTFWANYYFLGEAGYFSGPAEENPLLHTWSLAVEEQFYLLAPLILFAIFRTPHLKFRILYIIYSIIFISLIHAEIQVNQDPDKAFFSLPTRLWELGLGSAIALGLYPNIAKKSTKAILSIAGLALVIASMCFFKKTTPFPGLLALAPCLGASLIIAFCTRETFLIGSMLANRNLVAVGLISYSLYLWHWPILVFMKINMLDTLSLEHKMLALVLSFTIAVLSWRYIETPFRKYNVKHLPYMPTLRLAACIMGLCAGIGFFTATADGLPQRVSAAVISADKPPHGQKRQFRECHEKPNNSQSAKCSFGVKNKKRYDVVLWGDSHARVHLPGISTIAENNDWYGHLISTPSCPPIAGVVKVINEKRIIACADLAQDLLQSVKRMKPSYVILASRWSLYTDKKREDKKVSLELKDITHASPMSSIRVFEAGLDKTVKELSENGIKVLILGQTPEFKFRVGQCVARRLMSGLPIDVCTKLNSVNAESMLSPHNDVIRRIARKHQNVLAFFPHEKLCIGRLCHADMNNKILYTDDNHINRDGSLYLAEFIKNYLLKSVYETVRATAD